MISTNRKRSVLWTAIALTALVALPAASQAAPPEVASMHALGNFVAWSPGLSIAYEKLVLRVSSGDLSFEEEFEAGVSPQFLPVDAEGYALPDGTYNWELTVIPTALELNQAHFRSEEVSADGRQRKGAEAPPSLTQSGSFTIVRGAIADPNLVEAEGGSVAGVAISPRGAQIDDSDAANQ